MCSKTAAVFSPLFFITPNDAADVCSTPLDVCVKINSFPPSEISACANELRPIYDMDTSNKQRIFIIISPLINFFPTNLIITKKIILVNSVFLKKVKIVADNVTFASLWLLKLP